MCFSATGSFIAAGINGVAGVATLRKTRRTPEVMLAGFPILFAAQQALEGALWLTLPVHAQQAVSMELANCFVIVALVIWPTLVPVTTLLLAEGRLRRGALMGMVVAGMLFSLYAFTGIVQHPYDAQILGHSLSYANGQAFPLVVVAIYCFCTCAPLLLSSERILRLLGACVLSGLIVSFGFYYFTFLSVWCSFAAIASGLIFFRAYFELPQPAGRIA